MAGIAATVGIAVVEFLIFRPSYVNYDAQWALLWARDAWSGFLPEYTADFAPTPHPLATAVSSLALPFGGEADMAILWLTLLVVRRARLPDLPARRRVVQPVGRRAWPPSS